MTSQSYIVRASRLNMRRQPGIDSEIIGRLDRGTPVERIAGTDGDEWWRVQPRAEVGSGFVARRYLAVVSGPAAPAAGGASEILWEATRAAIASGVRYRLGDKDSARGTIDCSGWVAEITLKAFTAANIAAAPNIVFDRYDNNVLRTHSDGIIAGVEDRTGDILHGTEVTRDRLRDGMLIGCNFGNYDWEINDPPRRYGIDHIVQVVREPATAELHISQSSSGNGVNMQPLDDWLEARRASGMITDNRIHAVDPFAMADLHVRTVTPTATPASVPVTRVPAGRPSFSGRGMYVYTVGGLLQTFGTLENSLREMQRCRLNHLWVRIHGRGYVGDARDADENRLKSLIAGARQAGIAVAGWGWCQGEDPAAEARLASAALSEFGLEDYVADIEQGVNGAMWTATEVMQFLDGARSAMAPGAWLGLSSHGFIEYQQPAIFTQAAAKVDCVNPQAYWYGDKPNNRMLAHIGVSSAQYPLSDPASYARLCFDRWARLYNRPVVLTGQSGPEGDFTTAEAESKLTAFLSGFIPPPDLVGLNFWHWGATTRPMRDALAATP
jgi:hypothetical protein